MIIIDLTKDQANVLAYLKNMKKYSPKYFEAVIIFGAHPNDLIRLIERPETCGHWEFEFVCSLFKSITKTAKRFIIPFPIIEEQTEEDRILCKLLKKNEYLAFGTNRFFTEFITVNHVIEYLERSENIYSWNSDFVLEVQSEVKRVKEFLL